VHDVLIALTPLRVARPLRCTAKLEDCRTGARASPWQRLLSRAACVSGWPPSHAATRWHLPSGAPPAPSDGQQLVQPFAAALQWSFLASQLGLLA